MNNNFKKLEATGRLFFCSDLHGELPTLLSALKSLDFKEGVDTLVCAGDTVLDFTAGSMSLAVACYLEGRNSVCIEKDTEQFNKSVEWVKYCSQEDNYKMEK